MIGYVTVGTNDLKKAGAFYDKICGELGMGRFMANDRIIAWGGPVGGAGFGVALPHDGKPMSVGNGVMAAFGAKDIGVARTARMFNSPDRLPIMQEMILAETVEARQAALDRRLPSQRADFKGIFKAVQGLAGAVPPPVRPRAPALQRTRVQRQICGPPGAAGAMAAIARRSASHRYALRLRPMSITAVSIGGVQRWTNRANDERVLPAQM